MIYEHNLKIHDTLESEPLFVNEIVSTGVKINFSITSENVKKIYVPIDLSKLMWHYEETTIKPELYKKREKNQANKYIRGDMIMNQWSFDIENKGIYLNDYEKLFNFLKRDCKQIELNWLMGYLKFEMGQCSYLKISESLDLNYVKGKYTTKTNFKIMRTISPLMMFMLVQRKGLKSNSKNFLPKGVVFMIAEYIDPTRKTIICRDERFCKNGIECKKYHSDNDIAFFKKQLNNIEKPCINDFRCSYGLNCIFFHSEEEKIHFRNLGKNGTKCKQGIECKRGIKCKYLHSSSDELYFKENNVYHCKFGYRCRNRMGCNFYHTEAEEKFFLSYQKN